MMIHAYFITHMSVVHPQSHGSWHISLPLPEVLSSMQEAVPAGTTQDVRQQRLYHQWDEFYATLSFNPTLQDPSIPRIDILQIYDHRVQYAKYSKLRMD